MLSGHRICLITPTHLAANPRLVKEADALQESGAHVTVVYAQLMESYKPFDAVIAGSARWHSVAIDVSKEAGRWAYYVRASIQLAFASLPIRLLRTIPRLAESAFNRIQRQLWNVVRHYPSDLYIAHNLAALPVAAKAASAQGAKLGFDAEDYHPGELSDGPECYKQKALVLHLERRYLPCCDYVTAASPLIAAAYETNFKKQVIPILNVFPLCDRPSQWTWRPSIGRPRLYWFSQTIGTGRGLEALVQAMGYMQIKAELFLRGVISPAYREYLDQIARQAALTDRIHILPLQPASEMTRLAAEFDLGLSTETGEPENRKLCLTNKLFTYLLAGVPIVLSETPAQRALAAELGEAALLVNLNDAAATARSLDQLLGDPTRLQRARLIARRLGESRFNWDVEKQKLFDVVIPLLQE